MKLDSASRKKVQTLEKEFEHFMEREDPDNVGVVIGFKLISPVLAEFLEFKYNEFCRRLASKLLFQTTQIKTNTRRNTSLVRFNSAAGKLFGNEIIAAMEQLESIIRHELRGVIV